MAWMIWCGITLKLLAKNRFILSAEARKKWILIVLYTKSDDKKQISNYFSRDDWQ